MLPVFTIIVLLFGAGVVLGLSRVPFVRFYARYVALLAAGLAAILTLMLRWIPPATIVPSLWQPSLLFGSPLLLQSDAAMPPLAFVLALSTLSALLVEVWRTKETSSGLLVFVLMSLAASFVSLWAANPLTMIVAWASYDLLQAAGYVAVGISGRMVMRRLVFGASATLLLWAGVLLSGDRGGSALWGLMTPGDVQLALWVAAGVLRLWMYPFYLAVSDDTHFTPALVPLFLSPVIGWGFWLRLALVNGGSLPGGPWVSTLAVVTLAVGCFMAWSCRAPRSVLQWAGTGVTGAVLLAARLAQVEATSVIVVGCVTWSLGLLLLFLHEGLQRKAPWWAIPALFGALALLGVPFTLGFMHQVTLLQGVTQTAHLAWGGAFFFANLFLIPSLARWLLSSSAPDELEPIEPAKEPGQAFSLGGQKLAWVRSVVGLFNWCWRPVVRGIGPGLPLLLLFLSGLYPPLLAGRIALPSVGTLFRMPGLMGWLLWVIALAGGGVLAWQDRNVRSTLALLLNAVHDLLCLDWLYDILVGALGRGLGVIRAADEVVGGAGALLWSLLLFLLIVLFWGGSR